MFTTSEVNIEASNNYLNLKSSGLMDFGSDRFLFRKKSGGAFCAEISDTYFYLFSNSFATKNGSYINLSSNVRLSNLILSPISISSSSVNVSNKNYIELTSSGKTYTLQSAVKGQIIWVYNRSSNDVWVSGVKFNHKLQTKVAKPFIMTTDGIAAMFSQ